MLLCIPLQTSQSGCIIIESSGKSCFYSIFNFPHKEREYPIYAANKHSNQKATQLINWIHSCITIMITGKNQHHIACRLCTNMYHQIHCFPLLTTLTYRFMQPEFLWHTHFLALVDIRQLILIGSRHKSKPKTWIKLRQITLKSEGISALEKQWNHLTGDLKKQCFLCV